MKSKWPSQATKGTIWDANSNHVTVMLHNVQVEARVGVHPWEQFSERPNRLVVNVDMFARIGPPNPASEKNIINYDAIREHIRTWPTRPHTPFLEDLVEEVIALCFKNSMVDACRVSVVKPDIFNEVGAAGIEIYRMRGG